MAKYYYINGNKDNPDGVRDRINLITDGNFFYGYDEYLSNPDYLFLFDEEGEYELCEGFVAESIRHSTICEELQPCEAPAEQKPKFKEGDYVLHQGGLFRVQQVLKRSGLHAQQKGRYSLILGDRTCIVGENLVQKVDNPIAYIAKVNAI